MLRRLIRAGAVLLALTTAAVFGTAVAANADSGGGCKVTNNVSVCIGVRAGTTDPLWGDFYLNGRSMGEARATLWIIIKDTYGTVVSQNPSLWSGATPNLGHYGPWSKYKGLIHGSAHTLVVVQNSAGGVLYAAYSHDEFW